MTSLAGTAAAAMMNAASLSIVIGVIIGVAGLNVLVPQQIPSTIKPPPQGKLAMLAVGAVSGFGSGLSGAGGPVFSAPIVLAMRHSALASVGVGQVLQEIAAGAGSIGNVDRGLIDWRLAFLITGFQLLGVGLGVRLAQAVNQKRIKALAGGLCVLAGAMLVLRAV